MSKSDSLKNGMRSGLDGLLSSTGKSTQKKEPAPVKAEKEPAVHCNFVIDKSIHTRMKLENPLKVVPLIHSNLTPVKFSHSPFCLFLFSSYSSCPLCRVLH